MPSDTVRNLLLHDLGAMYDAELHLMDVLPRLAAETAPSDISDAFSRHAEETEQHAENLRRCFRLLNIEPIAVTNFGVRGLTEDHDAFLAYNPSREALIAFDLGAAAKTEHLEIASYVGLLRQAHTLGLTDVAYLLAENLRVEQMTASTVEQLADKEARSQAYADGAQIEEFRWSAYTDVAVETPLTREGMQSSTHLHDGLTPLRPVDLTGGHTTARDVRP